MRATSISDDSLDDDDDSELLKDPLVILGLKPSSRSSSSVPCPSHSDPKPDPSASVNSIPDSSIKSTSTINNNDSISATTEPPDWTPIKNTSITSPAQNTPHSPSFTKITQPLHGHTLPPTPSKTPTKTQSPAYQNLISPPRSNLKRKQTGSEDLQDNPPWDDDQKDDAVLKVGVYKKRRLDGAGGEVAGLDELSDEEADVDKGRRPKRNAKTTITMNTTSRVESSKPPQSKKEPTKPLAIEDQFDLEDFPSPRALLGIGSQKPLNSQLSSKAEKEEEDLENFKLDALTEPDSPDVEDEFGVVVIISTPSSPSSSPIRSWEEKGKERVRPGDRTPSPLLLPKVEPSPKSKPKTLHEFWGYTPPPPPPSSSSSPKFKKKETPSNRKRTQTKIIKIENEQEPTPKSRKTQTTTRKKRKKRKGYFKCFRLFSYTPISVFGLFFFFAFFETKAKEGKKD
ncbi:hypothetical protein HDV05_004063 [Chytridiales sp. JEL 0842]|nr:hypothetical protein HDV05_004063 [Chytridiales sp. JEL 0842]